MNLETMIAVARRVAPVVSGATDSLAVDTSPMRWSGPVSSLDRLSRVTWRQEALLIERATVWPETGVATVGGRLVEETVADPRLLTSYVRRERLRRLPVIPFPGMVACLNVGSSHEGYFHQWFEALPRAWVLKGLEGFEGRPTVVVTQRLTPAFRKVLTGLLPEGVRVVRIPRAFRIRPLGGYLHLTVPFRSCWPEGAKVPIKALPSEYLTEFRRVVDGAFGLTGLDQDLKLFVSRRRARGRHLVNDSEVSQRLGELGFTTVVLEDLPGAGQARLFRRAGVVVAQHGAALTNMLYCRPGTRVFELFNGPSGGSEQLYRTIAVDLGLVHESMTLGAADKDSAAVVPIDLLVSLVS